MDKDTTYWCSRKHVRFETCHVSRVKGKHTLALEWISQVQSTFHWVTMTQFALVLPVSFFASFIFSISGALFFSTVFPCLPLLPGDSDRGKQCHFFFSWIPQWLNCFFLRPFFLFLQKKKKKIQPSGSMNSFSENLNNGGCAIVT